MGFGGQDRRPDTLSARERRNANAWQDSTGAGGFPFIDPTEVIFVTGGGSLAVNLLTTGGLQNVSGALSILLDPTDSLLLLSATGLEVDEDELYRRHQIWS